MQYLPVCLQLRDAPVVLVGAGTVATRKARLLLRAGANLNVVAPEITPELQQLLPLYEVLPVGLLVLSLLAFVLAAQLYGDATIEPHSALRSFCLAAVLVLGSQSFMYALILLLAAIPDWIMMLRVICLLAALGLLVFCVQTSPQWSLAIFVSPQARVYAPRLLAAGAGVTYTVQACAAVPAATRNRDAAQQLRQFRCQRLDVALERNVVGVLVAKLVLLERVARRKVDAQDLAVPVVGGLRHRLETTGRKGMHAPVGREAERHEQRNADAASAAGLADGLGEQ